MKLKTSYEISIHVEDVQTAKEICAALRSVLYKVESKDVSCLCYPDIIVNEETKEREIIVTIIVNRFSDPMNGFYCIFDVDDKDGGDVG